jgi:transposase
MSNSNHRSNGSEQEATIRRRRRSVEEKREIAEASLKPGASVRAVAEAYGVHPSQVGKWRRLYRGGSSRKVQAPALLPVSVTDDAPKKQLSRGTQSIANQHGIIRIEFAGGARVSIEGIVDGTMLRAVLASLAG